MVREIILSLKKCVILSFFLLFQYYSSFCQIKTAYISGKIEAPETDSVTIQIWRELQDFISESQSTNLINKVYSVPLVNGKFKIKIDSVEVPRYLSMGNSWRINGYLKEILRFYIIEPEDSIFIDISKDNVSFAGRGHEKFKCLYEMNIKKGEIEKRYLNSNHDGGDTIRNLPKELIVPAAFKREYNKIDSIYTAQKNVLEKYESVLTPTIYQVIKTNILGDAKYKKYQMYPLLLSDPTYQELKVNFAKKNWPSIIVDNIPDSIIIRSYNYLQFLVYKTYMDGKILHNKYKTMREVYPDLLSDFTGRLRDNAIAYYCLNFGYRFQNADSLLQESVKIISDPYIKSVLNKLYSNRTKGVPAFDFSLLNEKNEYIKLKDFRGKVVFMDFWFAGCTGCRQYFNTHLSKVEKLYKNDTNVVFISVSIDNNLMKWKTALASEAYTSQSAINLYTNGEGVNHQIIKHYNIMSYPSPILIDRNGRIFSKSIEDLRSGGNPTRLIETIEKAKRMVN